MTLELTPDEQQLVLHILQSRLGELRQEVHHSTVSKFTDQLKATEQQLKGVIQRLESLVAGSQETMLA